jgi:hypothetical protein
VQGEPIKVVTGEVESKTGQRTYHVHASFLTRSSEFFQTALKKEWQEGQQRLVNLPLAMPNAFEVYVKWLYTGKLFSNVSILAAERRERYEIPFRLYELGEILLDREFQNRVTDMIVAVSRDRLTAEDGITGRWYPGILIIGELYSATPACSPVRRLAVDLFALKGETKWIKNTGFDPEDKYQSEFMADLIDRLFEIGVAKDRIDQRELDSGIPKSYYHVLGESGQNKEDTSNQ